MISPELAREYLPHALVVYAVAIAVTWMLLERFDDEDATAHTGAPSPHAPMALMWPIVLLVALVFGGYLVVTGVPRLLRWARGAATRAFSRGTAQVTILVTLGTSSVVGWLLVPMSTRERIISGVAAVVFMGFGAAVGATRFSHEK
jgi:hypothetical protein